MRDMDAGTLAAFAFGYLLAIALLAALLHNGGIWNVLANTRLLSPLIDGGIIALTDADSGLLVPEGVPDLEFYVASQDHVDWLLVGLAGLLFVGIWSLRAVQFHGLARFAGLEGGFGDHARAFFYGHGLARLLPYRAGDVGTAAALEGQGVPLERAAQVIDLGRGFIVFEVVVFALIGLLSQGVTTWAGEIFWPSLILLGAYLLTRRGRSRAERRAARQERLTEARLMLRALASRPRLLLRLAALSLLTFFLVELVAYTIAQAFTSANVIINVEFGVILMGVVGGYVATLIPVTPGGIGQWEWGMASALYVGGLGFPECVTLAVLVTVVRYVAGGLLFAALMLGPGVETSIGRVLDLYGGREGTARASVPAGVSA